jgi:hypothetical protein
MPIYRCVSKTDAATSEAAAQLILDDTGGTVQHASAWPIIEESDHWRVPVFSTDGRASMPFPIGAVLPVDSRILTSEIDRQIHQFDLKERREFECWRRRTWMDIGNCDWSRIQPTMKATDIEIIRRESLKRQMELWNARITVLYTQSTRWHFQRNLTR